LKLHNDSARAYGSESALRRACATKLSDPQQFFALTYATSDKPDEAVDDVDEVEPNTMVTIDQEFSVNDHVMEFSDGFLTLELLLADPKTGVMRSIQKHRMRMQISCVYHLSPDPSVLLVVNSSTPNIAIHQMIHLLRERLHTKLDIFNLSLTGSYDSPVTRHNVLKSYLGRTVIICGNDFSYFNLGNKSPWELLDPWETALLLKGGTSVLFANVVGADKITSLRAWAGHATFPAHDMAVPLAAEAPSEPLNAKTMATAIRKAGPDVAATSDLAMHRYPVTAGSLGNLKSSIDKSAAGAAKALIKEMPLRRFIAFPEQNTIDIATAGKGKSGAVIVCEGVPRTAKLIATAGASAHTGVTVSPSHNAIADYDMYFIVSCLPFTVRVAMFWNVVGRIQDTAGVTCNILYNGLESFLQLPEGSVSDATFVDEKVCHIYSVASSPKNSN
jgi:hypothetical protein